MGLAPKQRDRLTTRERVIRCFRACPTFATDQWGSTWPARKGDRHGTITVDRHFRPLPARNQFPFSLAFSVWVKK